MPAMTIGNFIPKYIQQTLNNAARTVITATRWNELWNLVIEQGDWNSEAVTLLCADVVNTVHKTGTETIAGVKTFSSSPIVPTPTTNMQAATKKYIDDAVLALVMGVFPGSIIGTEHLNFDPATQTELNDHKTSTDHDGRYYTETEMNAGQMDTRYYTETESDNKYVPKTLIDAAGDLIVGTAADTVGRLPIGTPGQVPTVNAEATALEYNRISIWERVGAVNNSMGLLIQTNQDDMRFISLADYIYTMIPDGSTAVALARQTYAGVSTALSSLSFAAVSTTEHLAGFIQDDNDTDYLYVLTWNSANFRYRCYRYSIVGNSWTTIGEYQTASNAYGIVGVGFDSANNYICLTCYPGSSVLYRFNKSTFAMVTAIPLTIPTTVAEGLAIYNGAKYIAPCQVNKASLGFASNYATGGGTKTEKFHYATAEEVKLYPGSFTKKYLILYLETNRLMIIYDSVNDAIIKVLPCYVFHSKGACFTDGVYAYLTNGTDIFRTSI